MKTVYPVRHIQQTGSDAAAALCREAAAALGREAKVDGIHDITVLMPKNANCPACLALYREIVATSTFDDLLASLLVLDAPHGFVSEVEGDESSRCWFASARNAASWVAHQSPERLGTQFEYKIRVAEEGEQS